MTLYKSFNISIEENKEKENKIELNSTNFIFTSDLLDITFVQISNDLIKKMNPFFLTACEGECEEGESIYTFQYPKGEYLSFAHGIIEKKYGFDYWHTAFSDKGSSGSPLFNSYLKVIGIHKGTRSSKSKNIRIATNFSIIKYAIRTLYNRKFTSPSDLGRFHAKELTKEEINELKNHGLQETASPYLFIFPSVDAYPALLFYRTNHAWYWTTLPRISNFDIQVDKLKIFEWTIIIPHEVINKGNLTGLSHHHEVLIMWLRLTESMYL